MWVRCVSIVGQVGALRALVDVRGDDWHAGNDLASGDDANIADDSRFLSGEDDLGLVRIRQDGAPGALDVGVPRGHVAVRMDAGHVVAALPEVGHGFDVTSIECLIERSIGLKHGAAIIRGVMTRFVGGHRRAPGSSEM